MKKRVFPFGRLIIAIPILVSLLALGACSKTSTTTTTPAPTLTITSPGTMVPTPGNVTVTVRATNFKIVDKQGQTKVTGEGHIHYYMDVDAPTAQGQPAIPASGVWAHVSSTDYTFTNVSAGTHTISVELVNNDHTPLNPPVVQKISITVTAQTTNPTGGTPETVSLVAQGMAFDKNTITVPAGAIVTIDFDNKDSVPHNFALYANSSAPPPAIFQGTPITASTTTYKFTAPTTTGTYFFRCDLHPFTMTGSFIVTAVSSGDGGGGY